LPSQATQPLTSTPRRGVPGTGRQREEDPNIATFLEFIRSIDGTHRTATTLPPNPTWEPRTNRPPLPHLQSPIPRRWCLFPPSPSSFSSSTNEYYSILSTRAGDQHFPAPPRPPPSILLIPPFTHAPNRRSSTLSATTVSGWKCRFPNQPEEVAVLPLPDQNWVGPEGQVLSKNLLPFSLCFPSPSLQESTACSRKDQQPPLYLIGLSSFNT